MLALTTTTVDSDTAWAAISCKVITQLFHLVDASMEDPFRTGKRTDFNTG